MKKLLAIITVFFILAATAGQGEIRREPASKSQKRSELTYLIDEQLPYTGILFRQHENGQLKAEVSYKNGKLDGILIKQGFN